MRIPKDSYIGTLCKRDHRFKRKKKSLRTESGACILCAKQTAANYYKNNKKAYLKRTKLYQKNNKAKIRIRKQKWYLKNKKRIDKQHAIYYENNWEQCKATRLALYYKKKGMK